jgi:hypothetical protein
MTFSFKDRYTELQHSLLGVVVVLNELRDCPPDDFRIEHGAAKLSEIVEAFDAESVAKGLEGPSARDVLLTLLPLDVDDPRYDELDLLKLRLPAVEVISGPWIKGVVSREVRT